MQILLTSQNNYKDLIDYFEKNKIKKIFLVCGNSFKNLKVSEVLNNLSNINITKFTDFKPNPEYESVLKGVDLYKSSNCDSILAVGGGSAIDVAKCIKLYATLPDNCDYLHAELIPNNIPFIAVPTTAGTGSEATKYAVVYFKGEKQSISSSSCIPQAVLLDETTLENLPLYHRKSTMMDAFCHSIESFWSINSTEESKFYSEKAMKIILKYYQDYLDNKPEGNKKLLEAANLAGKAINITQTTAGHAMCYKLTSLYGIAHGHAAALCVSVLWPYMINHTEDSHDSRGKDYLDNMFLELAYAMGENDKTKAAEKFKSILYSLNLPTFKIETNNDFELLKSSVNPIRLKNNPISLNIDVIDSLYHEILGRK